MEHPRMLEEFHRIFMRESSEGIWRAELEIPLPTSSSVAHQVEHLLLYAFLAECNDAFARMYGCAASKDIVGARFAELLDASDTENLANLRRFLSGGYSVRDAETVETDKNGNRRIFLNTAVGIVEEGALVRIWGLQREITEQKQREQERAEFFEHISPRQRLILRMIAQGKSAGEIATQLRISLKTVETHRARLMKRLKIADIPTLVRRAIRLGLVSDRQ